ncbi:DUF1003 domain-containing protein [Patescibacteria group bacterium]|nr:DUF1003 domain-containing protein [Patescibacteria group bacterium]
MNKPASLEEIRRSHRPLRNVNIEHKENLSKLEKFAVWVTDNIGTMGFFFFILAFNILWILWNVFAPREFVFDSSWSFLVLLFINNILQILFMPLIMVGQNLQGRHSEARAEADFEVNTKAEKEIETILLHLENQNDLILEIIDKLKTN